MKSEAVSRKLAMKEAKEYCDAQGKQSSPHRIDGGEFNVSKVSLVFSCLPENDKNYKRKN
jgi:hypothetical protein